jgi:hypothetical protein
LALQVGDSFMDRLVVDVRGNDPGALADEGMGRDATHATPGACDQRDFSVESSHLPSISRRERAVARSKFFR